MIQATATAVPSITDNKAQTKITPTARTPPQSTAPGMTDDDDDKRQYKSKPTTPIAKIAMKNTKQTKNRP